MPFVSEAQRRWMHTQHPRMAQEWEEKTPPGKLPEKVQTQADAASSDDPVLRTLARFDDPSQWVVIRGVPVFDAHEETVEEPGPDGQIRRVVRKFGPQELAEIALNCNLREESTGDACPITLGHTRKDDKETEQPDIVGYARDFRVGTFGPSQKMAILCDFWIYKDRLEEARQYPRRSVELWLRDKIFDPIALLKRTPQRDLGIVTFNKRGNQLTYQMEFHMKNDDPLKKPDDEEVQPNAVAAVEEMPEENDDDNDDEKEMEKFRRCMQRYMKEDPEFSKYMRYLKRSYEALPEEERKQYEAMPGEDNTSLPEHVQSAATSNDTQNQMPDSAGQNSRKGDPQLYARLDALEAENRLLRQSVEAQARRTRETERRADLTALHAQGYVLDIEDELKDVIDLPVAQYQRHLSRIKKNYSRAPISDNPIRVATRASNGIGGRVPVTRDQMNRAVQLVTDGTCKSYEEALRQVSHEGN